MSLVVAASRYYCHARRVKRTFVGVLGSAVGNVSPKGT